MRQILDEAAKDGYGVDAVAHLTNPDQAVELVKRTGVDAFAVVIGTSHGA
jgi:fructose-bisphosphate aldolase class II